MKRFKRSDLTAADEIQARDRAMKNPGLAYYCDRGDGVVLRAQLNVFRDPQQLDVTVVGVLIRNALGGAR